MAQQTFSQGQFRDANTSSIFQVQDLDRALLQLQDFLQLLLLKESVPFLYTTLLFDTRTDPHMQVPVDDMVMLSKKLVSLFPLSIMTIFSTQQMFFVAIVIVITSHMLTLRSVKDLNDQ